MKEKIKKALRRAYRKGRKDGFDKGLAVANMIYADIAAELVRENEKLKEETAQLKQEVEELNNEIIMGDEDDAESE